MNSLAESTLDAIELMYNNAVQNSKNSKTIECKVIEKLDAGLGLYRVSYLGNDNMEAYASNASINYEKDDVVYVLVPEGNDFSKTKIILGAASPSGNMYVAEEGSEYITISENLNNNDNEEVSLCTYISEQYGPVQIENFETKTFINYLSKYKNFAFSANIRTSIPEEQRVSGNYGVILQLPIIRDEGSGYNEQGEETTVKDWLDTYIDINNIKGNPYALTNYSLQTVHFQLPDDLVYDEERTPQLIYFVKGFAQDSTKTKEEDKDIYIKDVSFVVEDVIPEESMSKYYLTLVASQGNYFMSSSDETKTITPILKLNGKNTSLSNYNCYWFVEDASVGTSDENYRPEGGIGWRCLNEKIEGETAEDGSIVYTVVTNNYSQTVSKEDVYTTLEYKCVLTKEGIDNIVKTIEFKNLETDRQLQVVTTTGSYSYMKDTGYVNLIARIKKEESATDIISLAWQRFDKDGNYLGNDFYTVVRSNDIVDGWIETEISFPCSYIKEKNLIKCTFYRDITKNGLPAQANLGTVDVLIVTTENKNYKVLFENGDVVYNYDADGDAPTGGNAYDGGARVEAIHPINFKIFKLDNTEFTEKEYQYCKVEWWVPIKSMIKVSKNDIRDDYYVISGNGHFPLTYDIDSKFYATKNNNTIILKIYFKDDLIVEENTIKFIKDGQSGTNGTKYQAFITYNDKIYGEDGCKLQLVYINEQRDSSESAPKKGWNTLNTTTGAIEPFGVKRNMGIIIYKDNQQLILPQQGITIEWDIYEADKVNPFLDVNRSTGEVSIRVKDREYIKWEHSEEDPETSDDHTTIIRAIVTIDEQRRDKIYQEVIYCYYPVECTYLINNTIFLVPNLADGFDDVLYTRDGKTPKYNTQPFVYTPNFEKLTELDRAKYEWIVGNTNLKVPPYDSFNPVCEIKPSADFDGFKTNNYIKVKMYYDDNETIKYVRDELLANAIKAKADNEAFRDYLYKEKEDGSDVILPSVKQSLIDFFEKFDYNKISSGLTSNFTNVRSNAIKIAVKAVDMLNDIYVFCGRYNLLDNSGIYSYKNSCYGVLFPEVTQEKEKLYKLGYTVLSLDSLNSLSKINIDSDTRNKIRKFVNRTYIYNEFNRLIEDYNKIVGDYNEIIDKFKSLTVLFEDFKESMSEIIRYSNNNPYLQWLINNSPSKRGYADKITLIDYQNLVDALNEIVKNLYTPNEDVDMRNIGENEDVPIRERYNDLSVKNILTILTYYCDKVEEYASRNGNAPCYRGINLKREETEGIIEELAKEISDYEKFITNKDILSGANYIIHLKPIVMLYNRYELGFLNAWDGTKLEIGKNEQSLVAPQIGAGKKENNGFTGIVLGIDNTDRIGLFGFKEGLESIFLDAKTGMSRFGISGAGQIIMKPGTTAKIQSGNYDTSSANTYDLVEYIDPGENPSERELYESYTTPQGAIAYKLTEDEEVVANKNYYTYRNNSGMLIDFTTPEIKFGSGKFKVTSEGKIYAQGGGEIAGWKIGDNTLSSIETRTSGIELNSSNSSVHIIDAAGKIYSGTHSKVQYASTETPTEGFCLSSNGLSIGKRVLITNDGTAYLGSNAVNNPDGEGTKHWIIGGISDDSDTYIAYNTKNKYFETSTATGSKGKITITSNTAPAGQPKNGADSDEVYIGTDGIRLGEKFAVDENGNLLAKTIYASGSGQIGGWTIGNSALTGAIETSSGHTYTVTLKAEGTLKATDSYDNKTDTYWELTKKGGKIGGWNIKPTSLSNGNITIGTEGSIYCKIDDKIKWSISNDGSAEFTNVTITGGSLNINNSAVISPNGDATFNNITCNSVFSISGGGNTFSSSGGLSFGSGTIGLTAASTAPEKVKNDKISWSSTGGLEIQGDITARNGTFTGTVYANAGEIGGCSIVDKKLQIDAAHIKSIYASTITAALASPTQGTMKIGEVDTAKLQIYTGNDEKYHQVLRKKLNYKDHSNENKETWILYYDD